MNFIGHLSHVVQWSRNTFGKGYSTDRLLAHIQKEIEEVRESNGSPKEWVDIVILGLDGLTRSFGDVEPESAASMAATELTLKWDENEMRKWPDVSTLEPGQPAEHIRD